ncbi:RNHCP domain-containing protein [Streptomyces sp. NPDC093149]|uniref:RNHCP domain-containing protein n=1 Tax=Streptomyces sp. NPDC093149 TaxID=3366031 RepID=UPI0037F852AB
MRTDTFTCLWCGLTVATLAPDGSRRNHCPSCLHSQHCLDHVEGGPSDCGARMTPISIAVLRTGDWMLTCGELSANRIAGDDNALALMRMAVRPLSDTAVPVRALLAL